MLYEIDGHAPRLAPDAWVAPDATLIGRVIMGPRSTVWFKSMLRADSNDIVIGARSNIQDCCILHVNAGAEGRCEIGDDVTVGHGCIIHACRLMSGAFVGMGAIVLDGAVIEGGGMLAAGALLAPGKRVPAGELWAGNPARRLRAIRPEDRPNLDRVAVHYADLGAAFRARLRPAGP